MHWLASEFPLLPTKARPMASLAHKVPIPSLGLTAQSSHRRGQGVEDQSTPKEGFENWEREGIRICLIHHSLNPSYRAQGHYVVISLFPFVK